MQVAIEEGGSFGRCSTKQSSEAEEISAIAETTREQINCSCSDWDTLAAVAKRDAVTILDHLRKDAAGVDLRGEMAV